MSVESMRAFRMIIESIVINKNPTIYYFITEILSFANYYLSYFNEILLASLSERVFEDALIFSVERHKHEKLVPVEVTI